jgi:hypothetical protein
MSAPHELNFIQLVKTILVGAITLLIALAWNDSFKLVVENHPEFKQYGMFVYAISVTLLAIGLSYILSNWI